MPRKLKTITSIAGGALTAFTVPATSAVPANAQEAPHPQLFNHQKTAFAPDGSCHKSGTITWQDGYDNRYLEIYHSGTSNGDWADAYSGNGTCTQHWYAKEQGVNLGHAYYFMVNANSGRCLSVVPYKRGTTHVEQESCAQQSDGLWPYWYELSVPGGWILSEMAGSGQAGSGVMACEDIDNHWIYSSDLGRYAHGSSWDVPSNCIWH